MEAFYRKKRRGHRRGFVLKYLGMRRTIAVIIFSSIIFLAASSSALAVDFGGIAAQPANPTADARTVSWFVYTLADGEAKNDALIVQNNSGEQKTFDLYPADSTPSTGNGFALKQRAEKMDEVGSWVKLASAAVTLAPHEQKTISFTVAIPLKLAPGLYAGGIMVAEHSAPRKTSGIDLALRVGVRMYVTVIPTHFGDSNGLPLRGSPFVFYWGVASILALLVIAAAVYMILIFKRKKKLSSRLG